MLIGLDASRANRQERSGVEWYAYHLIRNLYKLDFKNQYYLYTNSKLEAELAPPQVNFKEKIIRWPIGKFWTLGGLTFEMFKKRPDLLFIPSHTFPFRGGKKNVITWHDMGHVRYPETYTKWELTSLKSGFKRALRLADSIITISNYTKEEILRNFSLDPNKIKVVYLGCNHNRWRLEKPERVKEFLINQNLTLPYFVYLGRLTLRKNIIGLIKSYNIFRKKYNVPHNLILAGGESILQNEIDEEIQNSPFRNEIKKTGWLPPKELPILLNGSRAIISPSFYEGFGLPIIEAMACGCPVIASTSGSLPEIVQDAGLLADAHDYEGFANHMIKVIEDKELRQNLINNGLKRSKDFTWEKCARETLDILNSI